MTQKHAVPLQSSLKNKNIISDTKKEEKNPAQGNVLRFIKDKLS